MKGGYRQIICKVESFEPDPSQYKPGKPHILPIDLFVAVDMPEKYFVQETKPPKTNCLTIQGFHKLRNILLGGE
jgi:hypothetical protein